MNAAGPYTIAISESGRLLGSARAGEDIQDAVETHAYFEGQVLEGIDVYTDIYFVRDLPVGAVVIYTFEDDFEYAFACSLTDPSAA